MEKMKVAYVKLKLDLKEDTTIISYNFPEGTEILSVQSKSSESLWIGFRYPSETSVHTLWETYNFIICNCNNTEVEFDNHVYISNITVDNTTYAVFYKATIQE